MLGSKGQKRAKQAKRLRKREIDLAKREVEQRDRGPLISSFQEADYLIEVFKKREQAAIAQVVRRISLDPRTRYGSFPPEAPGAP